MLSVHVSRTLPAGDVNRIQLIQECRYLEENLATSFTSTIPQQASEENARELKTIIPKDWNQTLQQLSIIPPEQQDGCEVAEVTSCMKICNVTLDKGPRRTKSMLALLFEITKSAFGSKPCPYICDIEGLDSSLFHHLMETHPHDHCARVQEDPVKISQLHASKHRLSYFLYRWKNFLRRTVHTVLYLDAPVRRCARKCALYDAWPQLEMPCVGVYFRAHWL